MTKVGEKAAGTAPVPLAGRLSVCHGALTPRTAARWIAPPRSSSACSPSASTDITSAVALEKREETVPEACIAVIAARTPLRHCPTSRSATAVVGGQPPASRRERDERTVGLSTAPRTSVPRLLPLRRDRDLRGAARDAEPAREAADGDERGAPGRRGRGQAADAQQRTATGPTEREGTGEERRSPKEWRPARIANNQTATMMGAPRRRPTPLAVR